MIARWLCIITVTLGATGLLNCSEVKGNYKSYTEDGSDEHDWSEMPGVAGEDYPMFNKLPKTNFTCSDYDLMHGFYADIGTQCQVYHVCHQNGMNSFLCPVGTIFDQRVLTCDFWYNVDCQNSDAFYPSVVIEEPKDQKGDTEAFSFEEFHEIDNNKGVYTKGNSYSSTTVKPSKATTLYPSSTSTLSPLPTTVPSTKGYQFPPERVYTKDDSTPAVTTPKSYSKIVISVNKTYSKPIPPPKSVYLDLKKTKIPSYPKAHAVVSSKGQSNLPSVSLPIKIQKLAQSLPVLSKTNSWPTIQVAWTHFLSTIHKSKQQSLENLWRTFLHYYLRPHLKAGLFAPTYPAPPPVYKVHHPHFTRPAVFKGHLKGYH